MHIKYDEQAHALYIKVSERQVARTKQTDDSLVLDFDNEGHIVGVELLFDPAQSLDPHEIFYQFVPKNQPTLTLDDLPTEEEAIAHRKKQAAQKVDES